MKIHIIQHVAFEGPGYILEWARERGAAVTYTRLYEANASFPNPDNSNLIVILGGPMSVNDTKKFSWLAEEIVFIKQCLEKNVPILGICLGAQLIAKALGAEVKKAENKEIGWFSITNDKSLDTWPWYLFDNAPIVFHWHGERFDIPEDAVGNLISTANDNQAFLYGKNALALQFHLEATYDTVNGLLENCKDDLSRSNYIQGELRIRKDFDKYSKGANQLLYKILERLVN